MPTARTQRASSISSTAQSSTVESVAGQCRLSTHLCFGNYKGRAVGLRRYAPMFPAFLDMQVDEMHVEMASREFAADKYDVREGGWYWRSSARSPRTWMWP